MVMVCFEKRKNILQTRGNSSTRPSRSSRLRGKDGRKNKNVERHWRYVAAKLNVPAGPHFCLASAFRRAEN